MAGLLGVWRVGSWRGLAPCAGVVAACAVLTAPTAAMAQGAGAAPGVKAPAKEAGLRVVVTVAPLKGIVESLLPPGSSVTVLMPPGRSEHGYEFTPKDLAAVGTADLVVYVGLNLETRLDEALAKHPREGRRAVGFAASVGITADPHEGHDHDGHVHDETCEHGVDPHVWLDPVLVGQFIPKVADAVHVAGAQRGLDEAALKEITKREGELRARVDAVDARWRKELAPFKGRAIVTHHNAFPRPAERYGLRVAAVIRGVENAEPTPAKIAEVVDAIKREQAAAIFVEPQYDASAAARIAKAAGVKVAKLDPIGNGDWFAMMEANLKSLTENLRAK